MNSNKETVNQTILTEFDELSNLVLKQLDILNDVFENYDNRIPENIFKTLISNEKKIDKLDVKLDGLIIKDIVLYKPVASDLRQLFAIYRMVINLERIGDHVIKIADFINTIKDSELLKKSASTLHQMLNLSSVMVNKALLSFANSDTEYALWTMKKEMLVDELNHKLLKRSIKKIENVKDVQPLLASLVDIRSIISSIERIGNHATNIAEVSLYALIGKDIRHMKVSKIKK